MARSPDHGSTLTSAICLKLAPLIAKCHGSTPHPKSHPNGQLPPSLGKWGAGKLSNRGSIQCRPTTIRNESAGWTHLGHTFGTPSFLGCQGVLGLLATTAVADMPVGTPPPSGSPWSSAPVEHKSGAIAWLDLDGFPSLRAPRLRHPRTERRGCDRGTLT